MTKEQFNKRVASYIKQTKLTHQDIANVLQIPRTAMSAVVNGARELTAYEAYKLCQIVKVEPTVFFNWGSTQEKAE